MKTYQEMREELTSLADHNAKLVQSLQKAREQIVQLRADLAQLADPPSSFGYFLHWPNSQNQIDVFHNGRKLRVQVAPAVDISQLTPGQELRFNENLIVVEALNHSSVGAVAVINEQLPDYRVIVQTHADEQRIMELSGNIASLKLNPGDQVMVDPKTSLVLEKIDRKEITDLVLEHIPDVTYADIGGLSEQIDTIRDAIELPFLHQDLFHEYGLKPPKGVLLYGPPGCGKTMIAKAVAHELAIKAALQQGKDEDEVVANSWFLNVKGPEILNKYVGETERSIRLVFERAREKASAGNPVVVFFDEMDSLFRTRGSGVSSDVESTIVPQLLAEIDGVESLENVIVIGASNREDMIDPAIIRPGRLDVKIRIERPTKEAAREILALYLSEDVPLAKDRHELIEYTLDLIYARNEQMAYVDITYADASTDTMYFSDFASGAMLRNIVDRAKKLAVKSVLAQDYDSAKVKPGINEEHLKNAVLREFIENEDLPSSDAAQEWSRVFGKRGKEIISLTPRSQQANAERVGGEA